MKRFVLIFLVGLFFLVISGVGFSQDTTAQDTSNLILTYTETSTPIGVIVSGGKMFINWAESRASTARIVSLYGVKNGMYFGTGYKAGELIFADDKLGWSGDVGYLSPDRAFFGTSINYRPVLGIGKIIAVEDTGLTADINHGLTKKFDYGGGISTKSKYIAGMSTEKIINLVFSPLKIVFH